MIFSEFSIIFIKILEKTTCIDDHTSNKVKV